MKMLYRFFKYWAELDVAIGLATGRNPRIIEADREMVRKFDDVLVKLELGI